jgi:outer membrane protein assembly factor BamE (lipoprotein component of BamABCDE complex)
MKYFLGITVMLIVFLLVGCVERDAENGRLWSLRNQQYPLKEVKKNLPHLQVGMTKVRVSFLLGSPAESSDEKWLYLSERPALLVPGEALMLEFDSGRYLRHKFIPVLLGEPIPVP